MTLISWDFFLSRKATKEWEKRKRTDDRSKHQHSIWDGVGETRGRQKNHKYQIQGGLHLKHFAQAYQLHADAIHPFLRAPQYLKEKLGSWAIKSIYYAEKVILKKNSFTLFRKPEEKFLPHYCICCPSFPLCPYPSLIETDNIRVSVVTVTTSMSYSLWVRTYWLELWSSADRRAREKHPDTKEPIGTCTTVSLYPF